jgi:thiol-disulfide isomerase/thioredoxin
MDLPKNGCLVLVHADWCGHCQRFMPLWNIISQKIPTFSIESSNLPFFENIIPPVSGFPTIFYKDAQNKFEKFEGERTEENIRKFHSNKSKPSLVRKSISSENRSVLSRPFIKKVKITPKKRSMSSSSSRSRSSQKRITR